MEKQKDGWREVGTDRWTERRKGSEINDWQERQIDRYIARQIDRSTDRQMDIYTDRQMDI
jgi:hypothetical protein